MYERPKHWPKDVWEQMSDAEKKCADRGEHSWYYDTCTTCGQRKQVPDYQTRKRDEESRQLSDKEKLAGR